MILIKIDKVEGGYKTKYFNIKRKLAYTLKYNEKVESCTEIYEPFNYEEVESLIRDEMVAIQDRIDKMEIRFPLTSAEKSELILLNNNLKYLISYDYTK